MSFVTYRRNGAPEETLSGTFGASSNRRRTRFIAHPSFTEVGQQGGGQGYRPSPRGGDRGRGWAVSQSSRYVGMAFGYYGLAWSVYSNVIAKGGEVEFNKNAMMDIRFGGRTPAPGSKFREAAAGVGR